MNGWPPKAMTRVEQVTALVEQRPGISPGEMARTLGISIKATSGALTRARERGFVVAMGSSAQRRYYPKRKGVYLSPDPKDLHEEANKWVLGLTAAAQEEISEYDIEALVRRLTGILVMVDPNE